MSNGRSTRRRLEGRSGKSPKKSRRRQIKMARAYQQFQSSQQEAMDKMMGKLDTPEIKEAIDQIVEQVAALGGTTTRTEVRQVLTAEIEAGAILVDGDDLIDAPSDESPK